MRASIVAKHWEQLIRKHEVPWQDLLGLLWVEADWLDHNKHPEAAAETRRTIAELIRLGTGKESREKP
jgi:hypothetical protein